MPVYAHKEGDGRSLLLDDLASDGGRDERTFAERACLSPQWSTVMCSQMKSSISVVHTLEWR